MIARELPDGENETERDEKLCEGVEGWGALTAGGGGLPRWVRESGGL